MRKAYVTTLAISASILAAPRVAFACPVCFGASDAPMAVATNTGIIFMLGIVAVVLAGFATFFVHLMRRASLAEQPQAVGARLQPDPLTGTTPQEGIASC